MTQHLHQVADIVSAYVSNNSLSYAELPSLIAAINKTLINLGTPETVEPETPEFVGAVSVKKSITPEYLISMIDGKQYRTLKRHLGVNGLTVGEYIARYDLPKNYPMVAAAYSQKRSQLAKDIGLGSTRDKPKKEPKDQAPGERGRPKKAARE